eukprot:scaffold23504_cov32-Tisochrysis_lutea.AAC.6
MLYTATCAMLLAGSSALSLPLTRPGVATRVSTLTMSDEPVVKYGENSNWCASCPSHHSHGSLSSLQASPCGLHRR